MSETATRPWERPFWRPAAGKELIFSCLVIIPVLAIVGVILFPLPSLPVLALTLLFAALGGLEAVIHFRE